MSKKTLSWLLIFSLLINISVIISFSYYKWITPAKESKKEQQYKKRDSLHKRLNFTEEQSQ